jgi:hypothetical protein
LIKMENNALHMKWQKDRKHHIQTLWDKIKDIGKGKT